MWKTLGHKVRLDQYRKRIYFFSIHNSWPQHSAFVREGHTFEKFGGFNISLAEFIKKNGNFTSFAKILNRILSAYIQSILNEKKNENYILSLELLISPTFPRNTLGAKLFISLLKQVASGIHNVNLRVFCTKMHFALTFCGFKARKTKLRNHSKVICMEELFKCSQHNLFEHVWIG